MSDKIKDKRVAETVDENLTAVAEAVAETSSAAEDIVAAIIETATEKMTNEVKSPESEKVAAAVAIPQTKNAGKGKKQSKTATVAATGESALKTVGLAVCKRLGLKQVWVTDDGQCFAQANDARAHGRNLANPEPLKVEA